MPGYMGRHRELGMKVSAAPLIRPIVCPSQSRVEDVAPEHETSKSVFKV